MFENHNKVLFKNVSETSYVYILSGQEFIKNAINGQFLGVIENLKLAVKQRCQTGQFLLDINRCKIFKCDIFE